MLAELIADNIVVYGSPRDRSLLLQIPGALSQGNGVWAYPLGWGTCLALRAVLKEELEIGPALLEWAEEYRRTTIALDSFRNGFHVGEFDERLRPLQRAGVEFLHAGKHVVLGSEMRSGKTPQTLFALKEADAYPALVVCPNSVMLQWADAVEDWTPGLKVSVVAGTEKKRLAALEPGSDIYIIGWANVYRHSRLSGYGSIALSDKEKVPGALNRLGLKAVVADEAHRALNPKAKQSRAMWYLMHNAEYRFALTGTAVRNSGPEDVWGIGHLVAPYDYPVRSSYFDRYAHTGSNGWGFEVFGWKPEMKDEALAVLDTHLLRHTYAEVFPDTPEWMEPDVRRILLTPKQQKAYDEMKKHMFTLLETGVLLTGDPLVKLARLSQITCGMPVLDGSGQVIELDMPSSKVDALLEIVEDGEPLVVFAPSRKLIELASRQLTKRKVAHGLITGPIPIQERQASMQRFQAGEDQVILCTTGAGSEGITLNRSNRVLFLQRPFSLVENMQAEARIGGVGQTRTMQTIDLIAEGTLDAAVLEVVATKEEALQEVLRDKDWVRRVLS